MISCFQAVTELLIGDEVKVEATLASICSGSGFTTFCGFLIKAGFY